MSHPDRIASRQRLVGQVRSSMVELNELLARMARGRLTEAQGRMVEQAVRTADTLAVAVSDLVDVCAVEDVLEPATDEVRWVDDEITRRLRLLDRPGRPGVLGRLVTVWADRSLGHLEALRRATRDGAAERAARVASTWRGATQNLGGVVLASRLGELEGAANAGRLPSPVELDQVAAALAATLLALMERVEEESSGEITPLR
ncbi:MAG: hypothetical protein H6738_23045 [Alphaproteobacteria bacterium]|nr:hypothetical protein [Alphaproteobacteria bacterium]MCB9699681.1 hypothetical protein [Alphaproteobacteria bacterium]